jgi:hypothetical protein
MSSRTERSEREGSAFIIEAQLDCNPERSEGSVFATFNDRRGNNMKTVKR